ncbi:MAG: DUF2934 domain-containing protein [Nitrospiria bacterium]
MKASTWKKMSQTEKGSSPEPNIELHKNNLQSVRKRISEVAYDLFLKRGAANGYDLVDWLEAERMVLPNMEKLKVI